MAQTSYPQGGYFDAVTLPDSGPYSAIEWAGSMATRQRAGGVIEETVPLQVDTGLNDVGVYYCVGNQLEVTNPGAAANTLQIDTGAALVGGIFFGNDTAVTLTVPNNRTNDLIVVRQNYTNATYVPPASVDADEEVPPDTARITRVTALVNDATLTTYWDIPLMDFTTGGAGAVTLNEDTRVYVDAETKILWCEAISGYDADASAYIYYGSKGLPMADNADSQAHGSFVVPNDFISDMIVDAVIVPAATGDIYGLNTAIYGACTELRQTHASYSGGAAWTAVAVTVNRNNCIHTISMTNANVGDIVNMTYDRDGDDALDTVGAICYIPGWYIEYFGWRR